MGRCPDHDRHLGRAQKTVFLHIPARARQQRVTGRKNTGGIGHRPPVTIPTPEAAGSPRRSSNHAPSVCSIAAIAGVSKDEAEFWPHAETSVSAATPTGCEPPQT